MTYQLLQQAVITTSVGSVLFTNIDQDYNNLVLAFSLNTAIDIPLLVRVNSNAANNYDSMSMSGAGSTAFGTAWTTSYSPILLSQTSTGSKACGEVLFTDYSNTATKKTYISKAGGNSLDYEFSAHNYNLVGAITAIQLLLSNASVNFFTSGSLISLYGVK
jgi:hypothetical protein